MLHVFAWDQIRKLGRKNFQGNERNVTFHGVFQKRNYLFQAPASLFSLYFGSTLALVLYLNYLKKLFLPPLTPQSPQLHHLQKLQQLSYALAPQLSNPVRINSVLIMPPLLSVIVDYCIGLSQSLIRLFFREETKILSSQFVFVYTS